MFKLKEDDYVIYEYEDSLIITKLYKNDNYTSELLWSTDIFILEGEGPLMNMWQYEEIVNSDEKPNIKHIRTIGDINQLKIEYPEYLI